MKETATQRMLKAFSENMPEPSPLMQAALNGDINSFVASRVAKQLGDEFTVRDIRDKLPGVLNADLAKQRGYIIIEVLGNKTVEEIREHGVYGRPGPDGSEIFSFNGVDVVQFWPPTYGSNKRDDETTLYAEQKYRRLNQ